LEGGANAYLYVGADPLQHVDPDGLRSIYDDWSPCPGEKRDEDLIRATQRGTGEGLMLFAECVAGGGAWKGLKWATKLKWVRRWFRIEAHQLPGLRNYGRVWHINVGDKHIIIDPPVIIDKIKSLF
jgi:hypothetical protein